MAKNYVCHIPYLGSIHHMIVVFGTYLQNDDIFRCFFYYFKILIFLVVRGGKMAKNGPKWQKIQSPSVSQELYLWLWFLVHLCKMMTSPAIIFIFSKFWLFVFLGGRVKGQNMTHNYQFQSIILYISRTVDHYHHHEDCWYSLFFIFYLFL